MPSQYFNTKEIIIITVIIVIIIVITIIIIIFVLINITVTGILEKSGWEEFQVRSSSQHIRSSQHHRLLAII